MLGKLLKHEWKAVWKVPVLLISILMLTAVLAGLTFSLPIWDSEWIGLPLSGMMMIFVFYFAIIAVSVGISIYLAVRYYKSMFTDEGYLTHTLPVSARQLLLNKVITMSAWSLISAIAVMACLFIFGGTSMLSLMPKDSSFAREFAEAFTEIWEELPELLSSPELKGVNLFFASIVCMALASLLNGVMMLIGSINLGQMLRKHRVLGAVCAYFGISFIMQIITTAVIMPLMMVRIDTAFASRDMESSVFAVLTPTYFVSAGILAATALGLYFMSEYLIRRRLELE